MKMGIFTNPRRKAYLATAATMLVVALVALWGSEVGNKPSPPIPPAADRPERAAGIEAPAAAARSGFDELPSRGFPAAAGKLFWAPSPEPIASRPQRAPRDPAGPPPEPRAPPLPFTYLGRIRSGGATTVFLARQNRESVARVGDILDDTYRVERIDETRMVLVYLPLGTQQILALAGEGAMARSLQPGESAAQTAGGQDSASLLQLDAPEQVSTGQEFVVNLSLLAGRRASVGVVYDPNVLSAIRRPAPGESTLSDRGRVMVDVVGPGFAGGAAAPAAVRFRVIGAAPATTQIQLEDVTTSYDSDLASLNVPAPRRIFVSSASATR
jgi:hypothetical protein